MATTKRFARPLALSMLGLGLMLAMPGLASASDVSLSGTTLTVIDSAGIPRNTVVERGGNTYKVIEAGAPPMTTPTAGPCSFLVEVGDTAVKCPAAGVTRIVVDTGAGSDIVRIAPSVPQAVKTLLQGRDGDDILEGGRGRDTIDGGPGGDQMNGNQNVDTVTYANVGKTVSATIGGGFISGSTLDGPPASRDQIVPNIEVLIGGKNHNKLIGSNGANALIGGPKQDKLRGEAGNDRIFGRGGRDYVVGKDGNDRLVGGPDQDKIVGGNGIDKLLAKDGGFDVPIDCGPGNNALEGASFDIGLEAPINC